MITKRKKLLLDLRIVAAHLRLRLSRIEILRKSAIALDRGKKKLLVMNETDHPYFKIIDLQKINTCAVKVEYRSIDAGDLHENDIDDYIEKIQLHISHSDTMKSVNILFYNARLNTIDELRELVEKANAWRDRIMLAIPRRVTIHQQFNSAYHEK